VWRMLPPHDGAGGILAQAILEYTHMNLQSLRDVRDCRLASHTGRSPPFHLTLIVVYTLTNGVRKNADACIWDSLGQRETAYPSIAIEVGYSDSMAITKSKVQQWVESTNCEVLYYTGVMTDNTDKDGYWYKYQNHRKPDYETRV
jgi:hypothetical protein